MLKKDIEIDGNMVPFRASATVPRLYRAQFKRDIFKDLLKLERSIKDNKEETSDIPIDDLEMFENVAYIMAKHADSKQPDTPEEWLDQFNTFSIYEVLPQILELWNLNVHTESESKKNLGQVAGK
ncbi:MAG TPA: hypothetical protein DC053_03780 [Lachnoclostridium sp.]|nr:hypothetical protein [Lachnoclostridium sp.]